MTIIFLKLFITFFVFLLVIGPITDGVTSGKLISISCTIESWLFTLTLVCFIISVVSFVWSF